MLALYFMNLSIYECIFESTALSHAQQDTPWLQQHFSSEPSGSHTRRVKSRTTRQWGYCNHFLCYYRGKNLKDFPVFFPYVNKIAARSRSQHGGEYPGLPGKVLFCSWSSRTVHLAAATQFCQHSAASWLAHSMNLICCQCIMQGGFCLYAHMPVWHRAPQSCLRYNVCFDIFPSLALVRLRDFCCGLAIYAK